MLIGRQKRTRGKAYVCFVEHMFKRNKWKKMFVFPQERKTYITFYHYPVSKLSGIKDVYPFAFERESFFLTNNY